MTKKALRRTLSPWLWHALCFLLPAAVMTWVYAAEGFYPFGDKSILSYDMAQQYVEYFCALKNGDVFFSWSKALGSSYIGVFSYYISSPLSLLTLLVPNEAMPLGLMALVILKLGLAGLSYSLFARSYFGRVGMSTLLCAVGYGLCTYAVAYSMCIMWLDGLIWLPIILLGLERVLAGKGKGLFAISLAVCFLSTWYISYMIGGFCLLWFIVRSWQMGLRGRELWQRARTFLLCALWALCLTAWLWLPSLLAMMSGKLAAGGGDWRGPFTFGPAALPGQLFFGTFTFFYDRAMPYLFAGSAVSIGAAGYFFLRGVPKRERMGFGLLTLALLGSMWIAPLDRVWHIFQVTHSFPYRYAFLLSFLLVFLAQHTFMRLGEVLETEHPAFFLLAALMCWEMGANAQLVLRRVDAAEPYESYRAYQRDYRANAALVAAAQEESGDFFRMGATYDRGMNSPLSFGYNGVTHYSSLYDRNLNAALKSLGFAQNWYWSAYYGSTHLTDALLGVRYVISDRAVPGYAETARQGELALWENPSVAPLAFVAKDTAVESGSPIERQNSLFSALTGETSPIFTSAPAQVETFEDWTRLTYEGTGQPLYLDLTDDAVTDLQLDGKSLLRYPTFTGKSRCLHCLGAPEPGESLSVIVTHNGAWDGAKVSYFCDTALLARGVERLQNTQVERVTNSRVELSVSGGEHLVTTIPAHAGWSARVDGKRAQLTDWLDGTFLALELPAGAHAVTLSYTPPGLWPGLILTGLALVWAGWAWRQERRRKQA